MKFALITLLAAAALATVAGWFSIIGFMSIYAAAPIHALILGIVLECGKLTTASWLYRSWNHAEWKLKAPLIFFTLIVMITTSIGVFGFLSKAHLEQGADGIDNSAKIAQLKYQIEREQSTITDDEKVIKQLDATIDSYLGKDRADRSLTVRRSQAPQRKQLRTDIDETQKRIDDLNNQKFQLESSVRKTQLDVGPIRYIADLFYGTAEDETKNIESAVRLFTLLIVLALDPFAVILLIAANNTLLRLENEKKNKETAPSSLGSEIRSGHSGSIVTQSETTDVESLPEGRKPDRVIQELVDEVHTPVLQELVEIINEKETIIGHEIESKVQSDEPLDTSIQTNSAESVELNKSEPVDDIRNYIEEEAVQEIIVEETDIAIQENDPAMREGSNPDGEAESTVAISDIEDEKEDKNSSTKVEETVPYILDISSSTKRMQEAIRQALNEKEDTTLENIEEVESGDIQEPFVSESHIPGIEEGTFAEPVLELTTATSDKEIPQIATIKPAPEQHSAVYREILGSQPHFIPQKVHEEEITITSREEEVQMDPGIAWWPRQGTTLHREIQEETQELDKAHEEMLPLAKDNKYPRALSWLAEFKRSLNG
jgi:hypothetical protein